MFYQKYIDPLLAPFRAIQGRIVQARSMKGNVQVDINRVKALGNQGKRMVNDANNKLNQFGNPASNQPGGAPEAAQPPFRTTGFWIFKKRICTRCNTVFDPTWDVCGVCLQTSQAKVSSAPMKTVAFVQNAPGLAGVRMLGWLVPIDGPQRGQLLTLAPLSTVGTAADCTICLIDQYMSQRHAEIKAVNGNWLLRDLGSTNGTYVNNKRIENHELIDNDFVKFGNVTLKFKSL